MSRRAGVDRARATTERTGRGSRPLPRLVVLCDGSRQARRILRALREEGLMPDAVVVETAASLRRCFRAGSTGGRLLELPLVPLRLVWRYLRVWLDRDLRALGIRLVPTGPLNGRRMRRSLARLRPDVVILAGWLGILDAALLRVARVGVISVHPGLLPWVRGNDVVLHAIQRDVPLGASAYWVDAGIDTGRVIERRLLAVTGTPSEPELWKALLALTSEMTVDVARRLRGAEPLPAGIAQRGRYALCRRLAAADRAEGDARLARGAPERLLAQWSSRLIDPVRLVLDPSCGLEAPAETV